MYEMITVRMKDGCKVEGNHIMNKNGNIYVKKNDVFSQALQPSKIASIFLHGLDDALFFNVER